MNYYKRRVRYIVVQNLKNVLLELMLLFFQKIQWDIVMTDTEKRVTNGIRLREKIYAGLALLDKIQIDRDKVCILQESELSDEVVSPNKKEIDIPVISVMGLGENCDKFQLQVKIKKVIEKQGYRVLALCSNVLGGFLGMENLPGFLYSKFMSYPEKIIALNHWIHTKVKQQEYDVILVGCPGGVSEFEKYETNYFGELPLIISNALDVDIGLFWLCIGILI